MVLLTQYFRCDDDQVLPLCSPLPLPQASLPLDEAPLVVCSGTCYAAVATSKQLLRIFTPSGMQHFVMRLEGGVVTMAAHVSVKERGVQGI